MDVGASSMIDDTRKLIFVHPEKSGGTSIERAFGAQIIHAPAPNGMFRPGRYSNSFADRPFVVWREQVFSADRYAERYPDRWEAYRKITVIRNPATRLLSRHRYFLAHDRALKETAANFIGPDGIWHKLLLADIEHGTMSSFSAGAAQSAKLGRNTRYDYVLRLENLSDDWKRMIEELGLEGLPEEIGHENRSGREPVDILDIVTDPRLRAKLAILLREDLLRFDYSIGTVTEEELDAIKAAYPKEGQQDAYNQAYPVK